jgi:hypothetical protein
LGLKSFVDVDVEGGGNFVFLQLPIIYPNFGTRDWCILHHVDLEPFLCFFGCSSCASLRKKAYLKTKFARLITTTQKEKAS